MIKFRYIILLVMGYLLSGCPNPDLPDRPQSVCQLLGQTGQVEQPKIIDGKVCSDEGVPVAKIALYDDEDNRDQCSGVLIASRFVLSAAHCIHDAIVRVTIGFGNKTYEIKRAQLHPQFKMIGERFLNDLVIYELTDPLEQVPPIRLVDQEPLEVGADLYLFGYGFATAGNLPIDELGILRGGITTIETANQDFITARFKEGSSNPCFGDSGGPAMILRAGRPILVGITSSGTDPMCAVGDSSSFVNLQGPEAQLFIQDIVVGDQK